MDKAAAGRTSYRAVIISPHLDDAVFSCGGLMSSLVRQGPVLVLNLFTGYLGDLKIHGAVLGEERYREESAAAAFMGFASRNLGELDAPFRRVAYRQIGNIFRPPVAEDLQCLPALREKVFGELDGIDYEQLYVPLGVGWHVDHMVTHMLFDTWEEPGKLLYYEDASYCCIPHATRYRLNDIATYEVGRDDQSLLPVNETLAWWRAARAYANTALMKNLKPWYVRRGAVPAVGFYLYRLMSRHRGLAQTSGKRRLVARMVSISQDDMDRKVDTMALYSSQFREFFSSRDECLATLSHYGKSFSEASEATERYWVQP